MTIQEAIDGLCASGEYAAAQALVAERARQAAKPPPVPPVPPPPLPERELPLQEGWWRV